MQGLKKPEVFLMMPFTKIVQIVLLRRKRGLQSYK